MTKDIQQQEKKLFIPHLSCKNCVMKIHKQCQHDLVGNESLPEGYCNDYLNLILKFKEPNDSMSACMEKFNVFIVELQSREDYRKYKELEDQITEMESKKDTDAKRMADLSMKREMLKKWWVILQDMIIKGHRHIVDREQRVDAIDKLTDKISLTQIHQIANKTRKQLEEKQ